MNKIDSQSAASSHVVHEAFGPPLTPRQASAAIALGVVSLLISGVLSVLLGALVAEHRLTARGIGLSAMTEALTMAIVTGVAGAALKPQGIKLIAAVASIALAAGDLATLTIHNDAGAMLIRGLCGPPEGILLWVTIGMIARTETPDRWAGVLFTSLTIVQLAIAAAFAAVVLPKFGADGGFVMLAALSLAGIIIALWLPDRYPPLPKAEGESGAPPPRGWIALFGTLLFVSANAAVSLYIQPLATQAHLPASVARLGVSLSLAAQVLGGALATALAGRVNYFTVFTGGVIAYLAVYAVYGFSAPAALFLAATALGGLVTLFMGPFLVPMTIEADPSRRTAVQSGAAQLLGAALGPLLAALVVGEQNVRGALWLGAGLLLAGLSIIGGLRFTRPRAGTQA